ncbi:DUF1837 domain-containing protein [Porphyrobacter algicida]|uniref:DUF1837 domain-containing protein n=1 Tax=Qipengyuania algicida TaxID=1836209 RepID=A0A845AJT1_9SPHN|nr:Hachiman antiphage defense system protein HamA [Qipengyuania algicida]MXP29699.1 DUF1837 domain-containing protein [Qipengyuania algicida]
MMDLEDWLKIEEEELSELKSLFALSEIDGGRDWIEDELIECIRSHYDDPRNIADDITDLGFPAAGALLAERLPTSPRARSGEIGEVLATEFIEYQTEFRVPVRRLRYKDGRNMALRGDDFLGVFEDDDDRLLLLKGEAKSGQYMGGGVIEEARNRLTADHGRPTPISLLFVIDRLLEATGTDRALGRRIRNEMGRRSLRPDRITHCIFTLTGNDPLDHLESDIENADELRPHLSVNLRIDDHADFIAWLYQEVSNLGDD